MPKILSVYYCCGLPEDIAAFRSIADGFPDSSRRSGFVWFERDTESEEEFLQRLELEFPGDVGHIVNWKTRVLSGSDVIDTMRVRMGFDSLELETSGDGTSIRGIRRLMRRWRSCSHRRPAAPRVFDFEGAGHKDIFRLSGWDVGDSLVVSHRLKQILESNGITGVLYESCTDIRSDAASGEIPEKAAFYRVRGIGKVRRAYRVEKVIRVFRCPDCGRVTGYLRGGASYFVDEDLGDADWQQHDLILDEASGKRYRCESSRIFVSGKVARLMLGNNVEGIDRVCDYPPIMFEAVETEKTVCDLK